MDEQKKTAQSELEIKKAAQLSLTEVGLGSIGHGFKIPLTGQILSLNQLGFLLNAINSDKLAKSATFEISSIAAVLKSFSPAGQKLGPMLSIAMQGFLFWLSLSIFGTQLIGQLIGAVLLSLWSFVQPIITLFMIYGFDINKLVEFYFKKISEDYSFLAMAITYAIISVLFAKIIAAIGMVIISYKLKKEINLIDPSKVAAIAKLPTARSNLMPWKAALRDLLRPIFLLSFILMLIFVWQINGSYSEKIWLALRPLGLAYILFYILRSPWVHMRLFNLSKRSPRFNTVYQKAIKAFNLMKAQANIKS